MTNHSQRRAEILATAQKLFAEQGFADTTTRQLNQTIGIADGLLYYYFPHGKQQLLDTIVAQGLADRLDHIDLTLAAAEDLAALETRLLSIMDQLWTLMTSPAGYQIFIITIRERPRLSQETADWLPKAMVEVRQRLAKELQQLPWLTLAPEGTQQLAATIFTSFQATLYSELLVNDHRVLPDATRTRLREQLHWLLTSVTA